MMYCEQIIMLLGVKHFVCKQQMHDLSLSVQIASESILERVESGVVPPIMAINVAYEFVLCH